MNLFIAACGLVGALMPARWWPWIDEYFPATRSALSSSVSTIVVGGILWIGGFIDFAQGQTSGINEIVLSSPRAAAAGDGLNSVVLQGVSSLSVFAFLLTPPGIVALYLTLSGLGRSLSAAFGEGFGDPILTAADNAIGALYRRLGAYSVRFVRELHEGPKVPDRIVRGVHIGIEADLVIVSARPKAYWDQGTIVRSGERWYRVGAIEERTMQGYLRTLYPLNELHDHGAIRRLVDYDIPERYV
jgi:hypothetical protein